MPFSCHTIQPSIPYPHKGKSLKTYLASQGHASTDQQARLGLSRGHHAKLALLDEAAQILDLLLDGSIIEVLLAVRVGGLGAGVGIGEVCAGHFVEGCGESSGRVLVKWRTR